jgi:hypothetical protein
MEVQQPTGLSSGGAVEDPEAPSAGEGGAGGEDHRDSDTLVHVRRRQAGQVIHLSYFRPGSHAPRGTCRKSRPTGPTRLTDPQAEQPTVNNPRGGRGSVAVTDEVAGEASSAGVAPE